MATSATAATTVYLEDIPVTNGSKKATASESSSKSTPVAVADTDKGKRQRTLFEMQFEAGAAKRQKVEVASRVSAGSTTTTPTSSLSTKATAMTKRRALGTQRLNSIPFSLSVFVESLPTDDARVAGASTDEIAQPYFLELKRFLYKEGVKGAGDRAPPKVYPQPKDIYAWSNTPLGRIKVVILGQDPYPGKGQAHGYSFSVPPGIAIPASLQNIYTEIRTEYHSFTPPRHGHLAGWVSQGVLLLNAVLTVRANDPNSHADKGWEAFTDRVLRVVDAYGVMAWGAKAAKRISAVGLDKPGSKHLILKSAHPSPRSADNGFFGNGHFKKANEWLEQRYGPGGGVDWSQL
ncbi:Uracil-DNA glycosylase [Mycena sanguinolenta]|uniref:Uracil-DNA glycosylase n=1 Tax=Mycena sanguinolenta TaxID=230812 RepID=A0A8H7DHI0_9AGAR|nr:Uracil-DNA glycosylase [Mycena sanguinolenta]